MTYDTIERSIDDAQRVEIYTVELPSGTYRLTSHDEDVTFDGNVYTAATISRSTTPLVPLGRIREITVSIALDHPLVEELQRYGIPPQDSLITIRWYFVGDAESDLKWQGYIGGVRTDQQFARIRVPSKVDIAFSCKLPVKTADRTCPHEVFDVGCDLSPLGGFVLLPTVSSVSGTTVVISSISGNPDGWARHGRLKRIADDEQRSILEQVGTTLTIDYPFRDLDIGDDLALYAGCDKTLATCVSKFNNVLNFGGEPVLPLTNPASPTGFGVREQA